MQLCIFEQLHFLAGADFPPPPTMCPDQGFLETIRYLIRFSRYFNEIWRTGTILCINKSYIFWSNKYFLQRACAHVCSCGFFLYIHRILNNNVISSEVLMKFSSKVKINVKKLNSEVISRLVRAFVHARAHIDKITYFFRETLNIWIFLHGIWMKLCLKVY